MNRVTLILTFLFSLMFSSPSYSEWTKHGKDPSGNTYYVDYESIRKHDGYVYWWDLMDYLKPDEVGVLSTKSYTQGDCEFFRKKHLSYSFHKEPMGRGTGFTHSPKNLEWEYPPPDSTIETSLKTVCSR